MNQVSQLARYDIEDAREAGPGTIPLKPYWLNYKIGDCLEFEPEDGLSMKVQVTGRSIEAQTGVVTYTVRGETDGKHAFALGQTGTAPPIVSLVYDPTVHAPGAQDWGVSGAALSENSNAIPAIVLTGSVGNPNAESVLFEVQQLVALQNKDGTPVLNSDGTPILTTSTDQPWMTDAELPATTVNRTISNGIIPGAVYQVGITYRVRGVLGTRLEIGPVNVGNAATAGAASSADIAALHEQITSLNQRLSNAQIP